jgi:glycosyltransferase involved in cell wall biosynthesis
MHVAVDGRALRGGTVPRERSDSQTKLVSPRPATARARGVARYLRCLLVELERAFPEDCYSLVDAGRLRLATAAIVGRPHLDRLVGGCDVAWIPAPAPVAVSAGVPYVLTVHDLSFEHRARDYTVYDRLWQHLARPSRLARHAERVLCVSEATRRAVIDEWHVDADRARTVLSGPGRPPGASTASAPDLPESFVLAVGALEPRKLPGVLAEAHGRARAAGLGAALVFAGDGPLRGEMERGGATVLGHVPDPVLDALYERALAVVCASREEGFGFTPLEAAARGTPAVVADLPVFAETLGDGALRVPPGDADALASALVRLEREPDLRERLATAGREAAGRLSWELAARETRATLKEAQGVRPLEGG